MRTRQERVATDTRRSPGCRTTSLEYWSKRKPTVEPQWAKQQTKKLRPKPTKINSFMSGPSSSLTSGPSSSLTRFRLICVLRRSVLLFNFVCLKTFGSTHEKHFSLVSDMNVWFRFLFFHNYMYMILRVLYL